MKAQPWLQAFDAGALDHEWAEIELTSPGHVARLRVSSDAVRVRYPVGERIREGAGAYAEQLVADRFGGLLLTAKLYEQRHRQATVFVAPQTMAPTTPAREHSLRFDHAVALAKGRPGPWLVQNPTKGFIVDALSGTRLAPPAPPVPGAVNHGWIVPASECRFEGGRWMWYGPLGAIPVQPCAWLGTEEYFAIQVRGHAHAFGPDADQDDYASGILIAAGTCWLDGGPAPTERLYTEPELARLVLHDGVPLKSARHPGVPLDVVHRDVKPPNDSEPPTDPDHTMPSPPNPYPLLKAPAKGPDVERLQSFLLGAGEQLPRYGADGSMSPGGETETALRLFQREHGLPETGIADEETWGMLEHTQGHPKPKQPKRRMVPTVRTPITARALADALKTAHEQVFGEAPGSNRLGIAWAQMYGETGDGRKSFNFNLGNVKATKDWPEVMRLKDEHPDWQTNAESIYKSYRDHAHGAVDYWLLMGRAYQGALAAMDAGDPNDTAVKLQHGKYGSYYEAPLTSYQLGLRTRFAEFKRLGLG